MHYHRYNFVPDLCAITGTTLYLNYALLPVELCHLVTPTHKYAKIKSILLIFEFQNILFLTGSSVREILIKHIEDVNMT